MRPSSLGTALAAVQELLGEHQDAAVAADTWRDDRARRPGRPRARGDRRPALRARTGRRPRGPGFLPRGVALRVAAQTDGVDALSRNGRDPAEPIRAAGGVLTRSGPHGVTVAMVHRPRHDDWTLPKGKLHRGEHPVVAARREVWEETGVEAWVGVRLPSVSYQVPVGRGCAAAPGRQGGGLLGHAVGQQQRFRARRRDRRAGLADARAGAGAGELRARRYGAERVRRPAAVAGPGACWCATPGPANRNIGRGRTTCARSTRSVQPGPPRSPRRWPASARSGWCRRPRCDAGRRWPRWPTLLGLEVEVDTAFNEDADPDRAADLVRDLSTQRRGDRDLQSGQADPAAAGDARRSATAAVRDGRRAPAGCSPSGPSGGVRLDPLP